MQGRRGVFAELSNQNVLPGNQDARSSRPVTNITKMDIDTNHVDTPAQMLSVPFYFTSPLTTLLESLHDPDCTQVTLHDIMEAYGCFSDRIGSVANALMLAEGTPRALRIIEEHSSHLVDVLRRDLQRPFSRPAIQHQNSFDLYSFGSPTLADDDAQYALDSAKLAQHALCFISDICILRPLYSLFIAHDFQSLMDDVFAFTVPSESPVLNESKLCTFIVWILKTQQLPREALLPRKSAILSTISRAIHGHFGSQAVVDGLKAIHSLLIRHGRTFLPSFVTLLSDVLSHTLSEPLDVRLVSVYALSGYASAMKHSGATETGRSVRRAVKVFVEDQHKKRKDEPNGNSLGKIIEDSMSSSKPCPCWALTLISSLIIIFDCTLFFHPHFVKLVFSTLLQTTHHNRSAVRALHPHIWKLLIWAYLRIPTSVDKEEFGNVDALDIKERTFKVVAQDINYDIGIAFVSCLLQDDRTLDGIYVLPDQVENALAIVRDMMCSPDDAVRQSALALFRKLYGLTEEDYAPTRAKEQLCYEKLFDGSLLSVNITALGDLVRSIPSFTLENTRQLTNEEIYNHWRSIVSVWVAAVKVSIQGSDSQLSDDVLSTWISLLEIFVQRCDSLTPTSSPTGLSNSVVFLAGQLLDVSDVPDVQVRHLQFTKRMWSITKNVLYDTWLPSNAEIILAAVLKRNFTLDDGEVRQAWSDLCAELVSVGVPTLMHVVYFQSEKREQVEVLRQLWTVLARTWQVIDHATTWDDLVTLLVIPFGAWRLSTQAFQQWESILMDAVRLAGGSSASGNAVITLFLERLGNSRVEAFKADPRALYSVLRRVDIASYKKLDRKLFEFVDGALSAFYPPLPESLSSCIDLLCVLGELIATCPDSLLLELVKSVQRSTSLWMEDENSVLLDTEQNIVVSNLYCNALERLSHHEPTFEMLDSLAPFIVSVFKAKHIPGPALGPVSFVSFWRKTYHGKAFKQSYPDDINACLKAVSLVWGESIAGDLTTSESQKSMSIVPDSQETPRNRHNSEQPHNSVSSSFDVLPPSPRRPLSSPQFTSPAGNITKGLLTPERSSENSSPRTPRNRRPSTIALQDPESLNSSTNTPACPAFEARDTVLLKGKKRKLDDEDNGAFKRLSQDRLSNRSPPQFIMSMVQKSASEPAPKMSSTIVIGDRSNSLPSPFKKRKLFDYIELANFRDVCRHASQETDSSRIRNGSCIAGSAFQDMEPVSENIRAPQVLDQMNRSEECRYTPNLPILSGRLSPPGLHNLESLNRSQSLPVFAREVSPSSSVQRPPIQRNQTAWARLEVIEDACAALQETDGISQVPVQDLVRATRLVEEMKTTLDGMMNRRMAKAPPKTK
ncbi:hypothetical protein JOM56_010329 [Amanita muscaria]